MPDQRFNPQDHAGYWNWCGRLARIAFLVQAGTFSLSVESLLGLNADGLIAVLDFALLFVILGISYQLKNKLIALLTVLQIVPLAFLELFMHAGGETGPRCTWTSSP
jgi:hypothetical protein